MLHIGNHLSSSKGFMHMGKEALQLKADTFSFLRVIHVAARPKIVMTMMLLHF